MTSSCVLQCAPVVELQLLSIIKDTSVSLRWDLRGVYMLTDVDMPEGATDRSAPRANGHLCVVERWLIIASIPETTQISR